MFKCKSIGIKIATGLILLVIPQLVVIGYATSSIEKTEIIIDQAVSLRADKELISEAAATAHDANQELVDSLMIYAKVVVILLLCVVVVIHHRRYASDDEGNRYGAQDQSQNAFLPKHPDLSASPSLLSGAKPIPSWLPSKCPFYTFLLCWNCPQATHGRPNMVSPNVS